LTEETDPSEAMAGWALEHNSLPHFLFRSPYHPDTVLLAGDRAVLVSRMRRTEPSASKTREAQWFDEQILAAARRLAVSLPPAQQYTNERAASLRLDPKGLSWSGVLVIDHPAPPPGLALVREAGREALREPAREAGWEARRETAHDTAREAARTTGRRALVVLLRRDWELLLHDLRSAAAVVRYLDWCAGHNPHDPPSHFAWLSIAADLPPRLLSGPVPPMPLLHDDLPGHAVIGRLLEFVSLSDLDETVRRRLLALIDGFPVEHRARLGEWAAEAVRAAGPARVRTFRYDRSTAQFVLAIAGGFTEALSAPFHDLVRLRHSEAPEQTCTFGFVLVPDGAHTWPYLVAHFTYVQGPVELTLDDESRIRRIWSGLVS
jgi:hypothetical protein